MQILGVAVGPHHHQLGGEVGIHRAAGGIQRHRYGAGDFQIPLQRLGGVNQHIGALFHRRLVNHALGDDERIAALRRHGVGRVIDIAVGRFVAGRDAAEAAAAVPGVGRRFAVQIVTGVVGAGQRPFLLAAPAVFAHHEQRHRRFFQNPRLPVFQPIVEPAQQMFVQLDAGRLAKVDVPGVARSGGGVGSDVRPGADQQFLALARLGGGRPLPQRLVAVEGALQKDVVPRTDMEHRQADAVRLPQQIDAPPVGAVRLLVEILGEIGGGLPQPVNPVAQRQMPEPLIPQRLGEIVRRQHILVHLRQQIFPPGAGQRVAPLVNGVRNHPAPLHRPAGVVNPALVEVGRSRHRGHRLQVRRMRRGAGQGVLGGAEVGLAGGADPPVAPGLAGGPFHRVEAVLRLLKQRVVVVALRIEAGAAILADHHIAALREIPDGMFLIVGVAVFAVRPARDQRRKAPRRVGAVDVGGQPHPVAHRNHNIALADNPKLPARLRHNQPPSRKPRRRIPPNQPPPARPPRVPYSITNYQLRITNWAALPSFPALPPFPPAPSIPAIPPFPPAPSIPAIPTFPPASSIPAHPVIPARLVHSGHPDIPAPHRHSRESGNPHLALTHGTSATPPRHSGAGRNPEPRFAPAWRLARVWIPAFAGMTGRGGSDGRNDSRSS